MALNIWPFNRLRTYSGGTPVYANDLNEMQDGIIYGKHGPLDVPIPLGLVIPPADWSHDGKGWLAPAGGGALALPLAYPVGTDITAITVWWHLQGHPLLDAGGSDYLFLHITKRNPAEDGETLERISPHIKDTSVGVHANGRIRFTWSLDADPVHLQADHLYELRVAFGQAARRVDGLVTTVARR